LEARKAGYDVFRVEDKKQPEFSEIVILNKDIAREINQSRPSDMRGKADLPGAETAYQYSNPTKADRRALKGKKEKFFDTPQQAQEALDKYAQEQKWEALTAEEFAGRLSPVKGKGEGEGSARPIWGEGEKPKQSPEPRPEPKAITEGNESFARTEDGTKIKTRLAVYDAGDLVASHDTRLQVNPDYPAELQPRDRTRAASEMQINRILGGLEPEWLGDIPKAADGAPIIGTDGVVESGNGRVIALKLGYEKNHPNMKKYKQWLLDNAQKYGLDKEQIAAAKSPILARIRTSELDREAFAREANVSGQAAMSAMERALDDAKVMEENGYLYRLDPTRDGDLNTAHNNQIIKDFLLKAVGKSEIGNYVTREGALSKAAYDRVRNAVFAAAYGKTNALEVMSESADDEARMLTRGLLAAAPAIARAKSKMARGALEQVDISPAVARAADKYRAIKESGETLEQFLRQRSLFEDGDIDSVTAEVLNLFDQYRRSGSKIGSVLRRYADLWESLGDPRQETLFGKEHKPEIPELLARAKEDIANAAGKSSTSSLFEDQAGSNEAAEPLGEIHGEGREAPQGTGSRASVGTFADIGGSDYSEGPHGSAYQDVPAVMQLPEIVELARELLGGRYPKVLQRLSIRNAAGLFRPTGSGRIEIKAGIAEDPMQLAKTLAHEIGHLIDYLPEHVISRGNILGRIASLRRYMKHYIAGFPGGPGPITEAEDAFLLELARQLKKGPEVAEEWIDEIIRRELPITPDDVLAIWNSTMENRQNINKDLEEYIKRLSTAEKKAIVKEALAGRIHQDLNRFHRVEEIRTGKKIKRTIQINPDDRTIKKLYQKLLEEEIKKRRLLDAKAVTNELKQFTMAWKPFDPLANKKYTNYRFSSVELYADALSALITNPAYLKAKAPLFYEGFFNYLENKPEVKRMYEQLQDDIRSGEAEKNRVIRLREGFGAKEDEYVRSLVEFKKKNPVAQKDAWGNAFIDRSYAILRRVKLTGESNIPDRFNPRYAIEDMLYSGSETEGYLADMYNEVLKPAEDHNINPTDLGEYMFHWRVATERSKLANPQGWTPELSRKRIREMDRIFGPRLKELKDHFYQIRKSYFVDKALDSKMFSPELERVFQDNEHYATFDIVGHFEQSYGREGTAKIFRQIGTFSPTGNPLVATLMKDMHLIYAINRNNAAKSVTRFMQEFYPQEIQPAEKKWGGKYMMHVPPRDPNAGQIAFMDGGKMQAFNVPKYVAETFEKNPIEGMLVAQILRATAKPFKAVFTEFNPGFWAFNIMRDYRKAVRALPGGSYANFTKYFLQGIKPAFRSTFGRPDQIIQEMRKGRMFISMGDYRGQSPEDTQLERLLKKYGMVPTAWNNKILRPFGWFFDKMSKAGQAIERVPKVGGYLYLKHHNLPQGFSRILTDQKIAHEVRSNIGSPAFLRRGSAAPIYNNILLFSNAIKEGWRSDYETTNRSPGEAAWKFAKYYIIPKMAMKAAKYGLMGLAIKEVMDRVSEYDKTNYTCYPLGMTPNGKAVYLRVPLDEGGRMVSGLVWKVLDFDQDHYFTGLFDYMAGQAPTLHPFGMAMAAVVQYASGQNPYDHFRGREAIPELEFQADDYRSRIAFAKWVSNQVGGGIVYRFGSDNPGEVKTELEKALNLPIAGNIIGRFVKVSDYGLREELRDEKKNIRKMIARETLDTRDSIAKFLNGEKLEDQDIALIVKHSDMLDNYVRKFWAYQYGNVYLQEYMSAQSRLEKAAVFKRMLQDIPNGGLVAHDRPSIWSEAEAKGEK